MSEHTDDPCVLAELSYQRDWLDVTLKVVIVALLAVLSVLATLQLQRDTVDVDVRLVPACPATHQTEPPGIRT